jgi:tripartite-type tricarboxylate transporter receptor subunit TctC
MKLVAAALALALPLLAPAPTRADTYPSRPITMIVVFAAGGPTDVLARIVADHMGRTIGQRIVIENLAGAGGTTGGARGAGPTPTATR